MNFFFNSVSWFVVIVVLERLGFERDILSEELFTINNTFEPFRNQNEIFVPKDIRPTSFDLIHQLSQSTGVSAGVSGTKNQISSTICLQSYRSNEKSDNYQNIPAKNSTTQPTKLQISMNEMNNKKRLLEEFLMENNDMPSAKSPKHNEQQTSSEPKPKTTQLQIVKNVPPKHFSSVDWEEKDLEMDD